MAERQLVHETIQELAKDGTLVSPEDLRDHIVKELGKRGQRYLQNVPEDEPYQIYLNSRVAPPSPAQDHADISYPSSSRGAHPIGHNRPQHPPLPLQNNFQNPSNSFDIFLVTDQNREIPKTAKHDPKSPVNYVDKQTADCFCSDTPASLGDRINVYWRRGSQPTEQTMCTVARISDANVVFGKSVDFTAGIVQSEADHRPRATDSKRRREEYVTDLIMLAATRLQQEDEEEFQAKKVRTQ